MQTTFGWSWLVMLADAAAPAAGGAPAAGNPPEQGPLFNPLVIGVIFVLFYFIMLRPKQREQQKHQQMLGDLRENDRVVTIGGIHGVVTNVQRDAEQVTIRIDESTGAKMRIGLSAISRVVTDEDKQKKESK
ncbi:MAG: preprotein translocase subunit YajC [Planctomycetaceae bacterium]|nr:preprotein translocase subunit YajC [Planctomycetaceae bacterium]